MSEKADPFFKTMCDGTDNEEKIIDRWERIGFLRGIDKDNELYKKLALLYERTAKFLLDKGETKYGLVTLMFPMIRQLLMRFPVKYDYDPEQLYNFFIEYGGGLLEFIESLPLNLDIDIHAEALFFLCHKAYEHFVKDEKFKVTMDNCLSDVEFTDDKGNNMKSIITFTDGYGNQYHIVEGGKLYGRYKIYSNMDGKYTEADYYIPGMDKILMGDYL